MRRQQLDRRYQSVRRTISQPDNIDRESNASNDNANSAESVERSAQRLRVETTDITTTPAVLFLTRNDFFTLLHTNSEAIELYNRTPPLKHMIMRIRRDPIVFTRYEHNRDLVSLLNYFADPTKDLPAGYESKLDRTGKVRLVYHCINITYHHCILGYPEKSNKCWLPVKFKVLEKNQVFICHTRMFLF